MPYRWFPVGIYVCQGNCPKRSRPPLLRADNIYYENFWDLSIIIEWIQGCYQEALSYKTACTNLIFFNKHYAPQHPPPQWASQSWKFGWFLFKSVMVFSPFTPLTFFTSYYKDTYLCCLKRGRSFCSYRKDLGISCYHGMSNMDLRLTAGLVRKTAPTEELAKTGYCLNSCHWFYFLVLSLHLPLSLSSLSQ